ncbi:formylmethanofuran dehydrogenase subunit C [Ideonella sp. DXS29W]|uniref:Formylmethanofuran dehydrogenase subunit C n=1 Tax=Ideonella lacteola TaxID=2984193 RepID=A0ABU9BJ02_9BURK
MNGWHLRLRQAPSLRVDMRGITPQSVAGLDTAAVERLMVAHGNTPVPLAEFFDVERAAGDALVLDGDLSRFDRIGWQMDSGLLVVEGPAGDQAGGCMQAGELRIWGDAGMLLGCEMAGGTLSVSGDAGDFGASTLPGSIDGMRGGTLVVHGRVGERFADRMRRGTVVIFGDAGDFLASRMVAGTLALGGQAGAHAGYGMRRGSLVFARGAAAAAVPETFVPAGAPADVFWQLLSRDLARHGGPFSSLPQRPIDRHLGDTAVSGKGELIFVR